MRDILLAILLALMGLAAYENAPSTPSGATDGAVHSMEDSNGIPPRP